MIVASLVLLCLAALLVAPLYFDRFHGTGNRRRYIVSSAAVVLLGLSALLAALAGADAPEIGPAAAALGVAAAAVGGGPVTVSILKLSFNADHPENTEDQEKSPVLRGGAWIGVLERTAIAATLLAGWPEGLAVVLAVKGLGRYPELGHAGAAERFILGTFASVLYAAAVTGIVTLIH